MIGKIPRQRRTFCKGVCNFKCSPELFSCNTRSNYKGFVTIYQCDRPVSQTPKCICPIFLNAPFRTEMFIHFCSEWCIVGYWKGVLWNFVNLVNRVSLQWHHNERHCISNHRRRLLAKPFGQAHTKENIKAPRHWPLWGESTGDQCIPPQRANNAENVSIWWRHHIKLCPGSISFDTSWCDSRYNG